MDAILKRDIKALERKQKGIEANIATLEEQQQDVTIDNFIALNSRLNALKTKLNATNEAILRLKNKRFCKNAPHYSIIPLTTPNSLRYGS